MHILYVTQYDPLNLAAGGPVQKLRAFSRHMDRRGQSVVVITAGADGSHAHHERLHQRDMGDCTRVIRLPTVFRYRGSTVNPAIWTVAGNEVPRADIIHLFGFYDLLGPVVARAARANGVPYIIEPLGMFVPIVRSLGKKWIYHGWLGRGLVDDAARVVATSAQEKTELIQAGIPVAKIIQRRNGIDMTEFSVLPERGGLRRKLGITCDERVILYLSRLSIKKNPDLLIRAFAELDLPNAKLVMAGPHESGYLNELQRLQTSLGLSNRVVFTGPLYGADKVSALVDADIFVLPSQNENFGNVIAEAIAAGTPVVITDQCGIAPYVRDRAGLVVPVDQSAVRDAISSLLSDPELHKTFQDGCNDVAAGMSWDQPAEQMETLYKKLMSCTL